VTPTETETPFKAATASPSDTPAVSIGDVTAQPASATPTHTPVASSGVEASATLPPGGNPAATATLTAASESGASPVIPANPPASESGGGIVLLGLGVLLLLVGLGVVLWWLRQRATA
jgi:hypothetical protein